MKSYNESDSEMIVMVIIRVKIVYIGVLMRLVSITPVMLNLIDYPRLKLIELMKIIKIMIRTIIRVSVIEMIKMIVMIMKVIMKVSVIEIMKVIMKVIMKIECIGVIVRLVSRRGGSLNSS